MNHPATPSASPGSARLRWCPDARLLPTSRGWQAVNFANGRTVALDAEHGAIVAGVTGLSRAFRSPGGLPAAVVNGLTEAGCFIPERAFARYQRLVAARIAAGIEQSHGFIIMPTEKCNFRCTYCYESFVRGRMSPAAADAVSRAIRRTAESAGAFSLAFFGGEPLLCSDLVLRFSREAFEVLRSRGLPYWAAIATNGSLLTKALFTELLDVGVVCYQITVDGSRELHDTQRPTIGRRGTFDTIVGNIAQLTQVEGDFHCVIRCNVQRDDYARLLAGLQGDELRCIRGDRRFLVDIHEIWASDRRAVAAPVHHPACSSSLSGQLDFYALNKQLEDVGIRTIPYGRVPTALSQACYAGKRHWFIIGPDLSLYKCTVVFDRGENRVGVLGEDGALLIDQDKNELWTGSNALTDAGCGACHYRVPCGGIACPLTRITRGIKGCPDLKSPEKLRMWAEHLQDSSV